MLVNQSIATKALLTMLCCLSLAAGSMAVNISGTLRGSDGNPVNERMRVGTSQNFEDWTDVETANGQYTIANLANGTYYLRAEPVNVNSWYYKVFYPQATSENDAEMVGAFDQNVAGIDIMMAQGGKLSGSVRPVGGGELPLNMAQVQLFDNPQTFFDPVAEFTTDQAANYASPVIQAGQYLVRFIPPPSDNVALYYGDALTPGNAEWVTIEAGANTPNISADLPLGGRISGTARYGENPVPGTFVIAVLIDNGSFTIFGFTGSDQNADYTLFGMPAGQMYLQFLPPVEELCGQWYRQAYSWQDATPVLVRAGEVTDSIDANFERGGSISGTIYKPDGSRLEQGAANIELIANSDLFGGNRGIELGENGEWRTSGTIAPGIYGVKVDWLANPSYAVQYYNNAVRSWDAAWIEMGAGDNTTQLEIRLEAGGIILGVVEGPDHQGLDDVELSLMDEFGEIRGTRSRAAGAFEFYNVPAGRYSVMATPSYPVGAIDPAEALATTFSGNGFTRAGAQRIDLDAGEALEVNITMARGGVIHVTASGPGGRFYDMMSDGIGIIPFAIDNDGAPCWDAATTESEDGPPSLGADGADYVVAPGSYTVMGLPLFYGSADAVPAVRRTFLGGGFDFPGAGRVNVVAGQSVDAALQMVEGGHTISGTAKSDDGKPGRGITAAVDGRGNIVNAFIGSTQGIGDVNGTYMLKGLPNGSYRIFNWPGGTDSPVLSTWYPNFGDPGREPENLVVPNEARQVAVNNANVPNIDIALQFAPSLSADSDPNFAIPDQFALHGAFPNPFNSSAIIMYSVSKSGDVKLVLTDLMGREVAVLADGRQMSGMHSARINGASLANGVYFAKMEAEGFKAVTKVVLMK